MTAYCAACHRAVARGDRVERDGEVYHRQCAPDDAADNESLEEFVPDGGQVEACPECDSSTINRRIPTAPESLASDERRYRCSDCGATFDEPVTRDRHGQTTVGGSDVAQALADADPDLVPDGGTDARDALEDNGELYARVATRTSTVDTVHTDPECQQLTDVHGVKTIRDTSELPLRVSVCQTCTGEAPVADSPDWSARNALSEAQDLDDLRTDGGTASKYVNPTGDGYHTTRLVGQSGIGISLADTALDWPVGTQVAICERPHRLVISPTAGADAAVLTTTRVRCQEYKVRHVPVPLTALAALGVAEGDHCRVYEEPDALVVVDRAADPREPGGGAGGD